MMTTENPQIALFWQWFANHEPDLKMLSTSDDSFWDVILDQLKKVDGRLWFEMSSHETAPREFVVTAEGKIEAFPVVSALVDAAPAIEGWEFVALKPPMGFDFTTTYEGVRFDPGQMWFLPLDSKSRINYLGLRVGIEGLRQEDESMAHTAVLVILDTGLGERSAALDIQYTEVTELPPDPLLAGYIELTELADYISWRKSKRATLQN